MSETINKEAVTKLYNDSKKLGENLFDKNFKNYIKEKTHFDEAEINFIRDLYSQGFASGFTVNSDNKIIWHDLRKNPDDLPIEPDILKNEPDNHRFEWFIVAYVGKSTRALYSFAKKKWFGDYEEMMIGNSNFEPKAWCDFPQFEW